MRVAILTHTGDAYVPELVADRVRALGHDVTRIDTDRFPARASLTCTSDGRALWRDDAAGGVGEVDLVRVDALWCRRVYVGVDVLEPYRALAIDQARAAIDGVLLALCSLDDDVGPRILNHPQRERAAENKLAQMRAARSVGLAMPRTLVSNDADEVRALARDHALVVKALAAPASRAPSTHAPPLVTSALDDGDLADIHAIRMAPMIVQERIDKVLEVRAIVVDGAVYAGAADAGALDWRSGLSSPWREHQLPVEIEARAIKLTRALGLGFGALDFVVDAAGAYWFLEVNPAGEWGFLARDTNLPIADAIARALVAP